MQKIPEGTLRNLRRIQRQKQQKEREKRLLEQSEQRVMQALIESLDLDTEKASFDLETGVIREDPPTGAQSEP